VITAITFQKAPRSNPTIAFALVSSPRSAHGLWSACVPTMASNPDCKGTGKRLASSSELGGAQRPEKKQRRQQPVTRINGPTMPTVLSTVPNTSKDTTFGAIQDLPAPVTKTPGEVDAYIDRQWLEGGIEFYQELADQGEEQWLEATKPCAYTDIEDEQRRKHLKKKSIDQSTAALWATWSNEELQDVCNMHSVFPVPQAQSREKLLEAIELVFIRRQLDEDLAGMVAGQSSTVKKESRRDSENAWPESMFGDSSDKFNFGRQLISSAPNLENSELPGTAMLPPQANMNLSPISAFAQDESSQAETTDPNDAPNDHSLPSRTQTLTTHITPVRQQSIWNPIPPFRGSPALSYGNSSMRSRTMLPPTQNECSRGQYNSSQFKSSPYKNGLSGQQGRQHSPSANHEPSETQHGKQSAGLATRQYSRTNQEEMTRIQQVQTDAARTRHEIMMSQKQEERIAQLNGGFYSGPPKLEQPVDSIAPRSSSQIVELQFPQPSASESPNVKKEFSERRTDPGLDNASTSLCMNTQPSPSDVNSFLRMNDELKNLVQFQAGLILPNATVSVGSHMQRGITGEQLNYISLPKADSDISGQGLLQAEQPKSGQDAVSHNILMSPPPSGPVMRSSGVPGNAMQYTDTVNSLISSRQTQQLDGFIPSLFPMQNLRTSHFNSQASPICNAFQQTIMRSPNEQNLHASSHIRYGQGLPSGGNHPTSLLQSEPRGTDSCFSRRHTMLQEVGHPHQMVPMPGISPTVQQLLLSQYQRGLTRPVAQQAHMKPIHGQRNPNIRQVQQNLQHGDYQTSPPRGQHIQRSLQSSQGQVSPNCQQSQYSQINPTYHSAPLPQVKQQMDVQHHQRISLAQQQQRSLENSDFQQHAFP
jgi:hypothetical protein